MRYKIKYCKEKKSRIDVALAEIYPINSRTEAGKLIETGKLKVNGIDIRKKSFHVIPGSTLEFEYPIMEKYPGVIPEKIDLKIIYEDDSFIIIDKPSGLCVHPGAGNYSGTIANAVAALFPDEDFGEEMINRPGIVHRLDKGTSGLLVIAKNKESARAITVLISKRLITKKYLAILRGVPSKKSDTINTLMARDRIRRTKMKVTLSRGKQAITQYNIIKTYGNIASLAEINLLTGRTHQIRVHMTHIGCPVWGDTTYGRSFKNEDHLLVGEIAKNFSRQALHASELSFIHPFTKKELLLKSSLPIDISSLMGELEIWNNGNIG